MAIKNRSVNDVFIAVVDGLKGFSRGHQRGVPANLRADLYRAYDPPQPELCGLEGTQGRSR